MKIIFWTASRDGSSWYRATLPGQALSWSGHQSMEGMDLGQMAVPTDVLVASRPAMPGPTKVWQRLAAMPKDERPFLVADLDDDYFNVEERNHAAFTAWSAPGLLDRLRANLKAADRIVVASPGIAESVEKETGHQDIVVVGNGLHAQLLGTPRDYNPDRRLRVGWSGSAATSTDFDLVDRAMRLAGKTIADLRFVGLPTHMIPRLPNSLAIEWCFQQEEYLGAVSEFDIWVAPYRPTVFNEAKFPTKALEAGMLGIPLVVSDIRPYREWITDGVDGILIPQGSPHLWTKTIKRLVENPAERRALGEAARSRAARNILQEVGRQWETTLTR